MKKIVLLFLVAIISCISIFATPFGLSKGMTYQEVMDACNGVRPKRIEDDDRYFIQPAKSHSKFKTYIAWISEEYGLYRIRGISDTIPTDKYGKELKGEFYSFKERVSAIYGKGVVIDEIINDKIYSFLKGDDYWSETLEDGDRELYAEWLSNQKDTKLKDDLNLIRLWTSVSSFIGNYSGTLIIDYQFDNVGQVKNKEDDVL